MADSDNGDELGNFMDVSDGDEAFARHQQEATQRDHKTRESEQDETTENDTEPNEETTKELDL